MSIIVQKYGGSSVGNTERIKNVAARVAGYRAQGHQIVVVVSAMSGVTDGLIKLAKEIMPLPSEREMDMLLATGEQTTIALTAIAARAGVPRLLTGPQAGIVTDGVHTKAKIQNTLPRKSTACSTRAPWSSLPVFKAKRTTARSQRWGAAARLDRHRTRGLLKADLVKSTPTSTAFTPPTRASCRLKAPRFP
jgi:hypothetical protein